MTNARLLAVLMAFTVSTAPRLISGRTLVANEIDGGFEIQQQDSRLVINFASKPVTEFVFKDEKILRPFFANVRLPSIHKATRNHPPNPAVDAVDHDTMHPGVWLGFGDINQEDFWRNKGRIEHVRFSTEPVVRNGVLHFAEDSRLLRASGKKLAELHSDYQLRRRRGGFLLTWDAELRASEEDLVFGDQEEMGLGARLSTSLTEKSGGQVISSDGLKSAAETWGKQAAWCDYSGKIGTQVVGITIFPSPQNAYPCWWHNRDYGVFVANPFGKRAGHVDGKLTVKKGDSLKLKFHVVFHEGPTMPDLAAIAKEIAE